MDKSDNLYNSLKEAMESFKQSGKNLKPITDIIDPIVEYCRIMDEKLNPFYEKFKKVSDVLDKVDLIKRTMQRISNFQLENQRIDKEPYFGIFQ